MSEQKFKVLIVENENIIALDIKKILEEINCEVIAITNTGESAIDVIKKNKPQLITMNLQLNGLIDGESTAAIIYQKHRVPIIFITGSVSKEKKLKQIIKDSLFYIKKPFKKSELIEAVQKVLQSGYN